MKKYFEIIFSSCPITAQPYLDFIGHKKFVFLLSNQLNLKSSCVTTSTHSMKWHEIGRKYYRLYTAYFYIQSGVHMEGFMQFDCKASNSFHGRHFT